MKITCKDCIEKISEYKWVLMTWLMTVIFGVALIFYRNDPKKIAIINLAEKISMLFITRSCSIQSQLFLLL